MAVSGHKTRSVFNRYNIVNEADLEKAARSLTEYFEREKAKMVTLSVTPAEFNGQSSGEDDSELVGMSAGSMELARGIEPSAAYKSVLRGRSSPWRCGQPRLSSIFTLDRFAPLANTPIISTQPTSTLTTNRHTPLVISLGPILCL